MDGVDRYCRDIVMRAVWWASFSINQRMFHTVFGPAIVMLVVADPAVASDPTDVASPLTNEQKDLAAFVMEGVWAARENLRSAVVEITDHNTQQRPSRDVKESYFVAFDRDTDRLRFDRRKAERITQLIRTSEETIVLVDGKGIIGRYEADHEPGVYDIDPFDLRLVGIATYSEHDFRASYEGFREFYDSISISDVVRETATRVRLTWDYMAQVTPIRRTLWVDTEQGFTPIKLKVDAFPVKTKFDGPPKSYFDGKLKWINIGDVWLPHEWVFADPSRALEGRLDFNWSQVNEAIENSYFTPDGLNARKGTAVVNNRLGEPVVEYNIGLTVPKAQPAKIANAPRSRFRLWFFGVNIAVVLIVAGYLVRRRIAGA